MWYVNYVKVIFVLFFDIVLAMFTLTELFFADEAVSNLSQERIFDDRLISPFFYFNFKEGHCTFESILFFLFS